MRGISIWIISMWRMSRSGMKRTLWSLAYLFLPSLMVNPIVYDLIPKPTDLVFLAACVITLAGIVLFIVKKPCNFFAALAGLLLPGLVAAICEAFILGELWLFSLFVAFFYALPSAILLLIACLISRIINKRKKERL